MNDLVWHGLVWSLYCEEQNQTLINVAMRIIGSQDIPSLQVIFKDTTLRQARRVSSDPEHALYSEFELLPSGQSFRAVKFKRNQFRFSFLPTSVALMNKYS